MCGKVIEENKDASSAQAKLNGVDDMDYALSAWNLTT